MKLSWVLYIIIFLLAAFLRLYVLQSVPPGVNQDEASIGYTAYSLIKTGNDEYGRHLPFSFQSFGDWKLPLYIYITVPFVLVFGLSELAVRLPSALFGIATVAVVYFFVQQLFNNRLLSFITMFLIAIAPWSLHLSRVESESNTAVFFTTLGMLLFLKGLKNKWLFFPAAVFLALTYFTYAGNYVFTTLLVLGTLVVFRKQIPKSRTFFIAAIVFVMLSGFITYNNVFANKTKISGIGIFGDPAVVHAKIEIPRNQHVEPNSVLARIVHNKFVFATQRFVQNYFNSYSPQFLFITGGTNHAHNIEGFGNMYLAEAPFLILGLFGLFNAKKSKEKYLVLIWFFISPIAASLTKDAPHTNRMFSIFPILPLVVAFGIEFLYEKIRPLKNVSYLVISGIFLSFIINFLIYLDAYYVHFPREEARSWGIGYKELSRRLTSQYKDKQIIMSHPQYSNYAYLLFYSRYDPLTYQRQASRYAPTPDGFVHVKEYGNIMFRNIDFAVDTKLPQTLLVAFPQDVTYEIVHGSHNVSEVTLPNGEIIFYLIET